MSDVLTKEEEAALADHDIRVVALAAGRIIDRLVAEVERLRNANDLLDRSVGEEIDERDRRGDLLDEFVEAAGGVSVCGEHSSANDPWTHALENFQQLSLRNERLSKAATVCEEVYKLLRNDCLMPDRHKIRNREPDLCADCLAFALGSMSRSLSALNPPASEGGGLEVRMKA